MLNCFSCARVRSSGGGNLQSDSFFRSETCAIGDFLTRTRPGLRTPRLKKERERKERDRAGASASETDEGRDKQTTRQRPRERRLKRCTQDIETGDDRQRRWILIQADTPSADTNSNPASRCRSHARHWYRLKEDRVGYIS